MEYKVWTVEDIRNYIDIIGEEANYKCSHKIPIYIQDIGGDSVNKNEFVGGALCYNTKISKGKKRYLCTEYFVFNEYLCNGSIPEELVEQVIKHEYCHFITIDKTRNLHNHDKLFKKNCKLIGCNLLGKIVELNI